MGFNSLTASYPLTKFYLTQKMSEGELRDSTPSVCFKVLSLKLLCIMKEDLVIPFNFVVGEVEFS